MRSSCRLRYVLVLKFFSILFQSCVIVGSTAEVPAAAASGRTSIGPFPLVAECFSHDRREADGNNMPAPQSAAMHGTIDITRCCSLEGSTRDFCGLFFVRLKCRHEPLSTNKRSPFVFAFNQLTNLVTCLQYNKLGAFRIDYGLTIRWREGCSNHLKDKPTRSLKVNRVKTGKRDWRAIAAGFRSR